MKGMFIVIGIGLLLSSACSKDTFITGPEALLSTSDDTLHFDTVFTTTGSITQFFRLYNRNDQKLRISSVKLQGGLSSYFKMNVDGISGTEIKNLEIEANDSAYVFVTVKIDPNAADLPFVVQDSIQINYNGLVKWVQLDAWGQNARFYRSQLITTNETWDNQLPYVIIGGIAVAPNVTLTLLPGTKIYLHADAPLLIDGTLKAVGGVEDSNHIVFRSDRLDEPYRDFPAGWPGIYFGETSRQNELEYVSVLNAYQGLVVQKPSVDGQPKLKLRACYIDNCYDAGLIGLQSEVVAENCLFSNCGKGIILALGGRYRFTHCTGVSYSNPYFDHKDPVVQVYDFFKTSNTVLISPLNAQFTNCLFWGENGIVENEVVTGKQGNDYSVTFTHCLWKAKVNPANSTLQQIIVNQPPSFDSINIQERYFNFRLRAGSPALNKGIPTSLERDLDGLPRSVDLPDLGCYERQIP